MAIADTTRRPPDHPRGLFFAPSGDLKSDGLNDAQLKQAEHPVL